METTKVDNKCLFAPSEVLTKTDNVVTGSTPNREALVKMGQHKRVNKEFHQICVKHTPMMIDEILYIAYYSWE